MFWVKTMMMLMLAITMAMTVMVMSGCETQEQFKTDDFLTITLNKSLQNYDDFSDNPDSF